MSKKIIKRSILAVLGTVILMGIILVVHIYMVTHPKADGYFEGVLMGRIDFKEKVDSTRSYEIRHFVNSIDGIQKSYFNREDNILVFSYYADKQKPENIYKALMASGNYNARRFIASGTGGACPVIDKNSFTYKAGAFLQNIFK